VRKQLQQRWCPLIRVISAVSTSTDRRHIGSALIRLLPFSAAMRTTILVVAKVLRTPVARRPARLAFELCNGERGRTPLCLGRESAWRRSMRTLRGTVLNHYDAVEALRHPPMRFGASAKRACGELPRLTKRVDGRRADPKPRCCLPDGQDGRCSAFPSGSSSPLRFLDQG
jgi:hypothetical protein